MSCEVVTTRAGALAVLDHATGEVMHPLAGPLEEPLRLYLTPSRLEARLRESSPAPLVVFDIGLGAGSVAVAVWRLSARMPPGSRRLELVSFDRDRSALALALAHPADFGYEGEAGVAARAVLEHGLFEDARTRWRYVGGELPATLDDEAAASADVTYWDAFSPKRNPELWTLGAFRALRRCCQEGATVHTYSGATATRSVLLLAGFAVGVGEPIGNDKFGTHAALALADVTQPLDRRWLERLGRSSAPFPVDAPTDALALVAAAPQFR